MMSVLLAIFLATQSQAPADPNAGKIPIIVAETVPAVKAPSKESRGELFTRVFGTTILGAVAATQGYNIFADEINTKTRFMYNFGAGLMYMNFLSMGVTHEKVTKTSLCKLLFFLTETGLLVAAEAQPEGQKNPLYGRLAAAGAYGYYFCLSIDIWRTKSK